MPRYKVLLTDYAWPDLQLERELLREVDAELVVASARTPEILAREAADAAALMTTWVDVPRSVIEAAQRCRIVARLGIGLDNIDVEQCTRQGIPVTNVPDYCTIEVAEHALACILALARNLNWFHLDAKHHRYDRQAGPPLRRVEGQTLGIVGLGNIGAALARKAQALGLRVIAYSRRARQVEGVTLGSLRELLEQSDFVSLHVPLTPETRRLIGAAELSLMRPTAFLINTARGALVDPEALAQALAENRLAGAALDVQDPEPPDLHQPLYQDPRVIVTPHAAFVSHEALHDLRVRATRQVITRLKGGTPPHIVNPAFTDTSGTIDGVQ